MPGVIWVQSVWHSNGILKRILQKSWFWNKFTDNEKAWTIFRGEGKELNRQVDHPTHYTAINDIRHLDSIQPVYFGLNNWFDLVCFEVKSSEAISLVELNGLIEH